MLYTSLSASVSQPSHQHGLSRVPADLASRLYFLFSVKFPKARMHLLLSLCGGRDTGCRLKHTDLSPGPLPYTPPPPQ